VSAPWTRLPVLVRSGHAAHATPLGVIRQPAAADARDCFDHPTVAQRACASATNVVSRRHGASRYRASGPGPNPSCAPTFCLVNAIARRVVTASPLCHEIDRQRRYIRTLDIAWKHAPATHARRSRTRSRTPLLLSQKARVRTCPTPHPFLACAPAHTQPLVDAAADDCFTRRDVADRTIGLATIRSRPPSSARAEATSAFAQDNRGCGLWPAVASGRIRWALATGGWPSKSMCAGRGPAARATVSVHTHGGR
jgi:hypothetical protein